jgi:hypothetical protein
MYCVMSAAEEKYNARNELDEVFEEVESYDPSEYLEDMFQEYDEMCAYDLAQAHIENKLFHGR